MKISKTILFSAAALLSGLCTVPAGAEVTRITDGETSVSVDAPLTRDYCISSTGTLKLVLEGSYTFSGCFLGSSSLLTENPDLLAADVELPQDYGSGNGYYDIGGSGGKIEISGDGVLEYAGFQNAVNYYSATFTTTHGQTHGEFEKYFTQTILGVSASATVDVSKTAFSGQLTVSGNATLVVSGYLSQFVSWSKPQPQPTGSPIAYPQIFDIGQVGVSNVVLADNAKISFASSSLNLLSKPFELGGSGDSGASSGAEGVRRLNFLHNVKAGINTTIELGVDAASASRIVIETSGADNEYGWDGEATIGKLSGTGRVYFTSGANGYGTDGGLVSITNRAEFETLKADGGSVSTLSLQVSSESSVRDYVRNLSATYALSGQSRTTDDGAETLVSGVLADVFLLTNAVIGSDSTGTYVVDNVLETATAVQFDTLMDGGDTTQNYYAQISGSLWECLPDYVPYGTQSAGSVTIHGTQVLNNLQSLFFERQTLQDEATAGGGGFYEITRFFINNSSRDYAGLAVNTQVYVRTDSALIINQQKDRDGVFGGRFYTTDDDVVTTGSQANDGYIIKVGEGTFANLSSSGLAASVINRLFIYEGEWMADPESLGTGRVYVGTAGSLRIIANDTSTLSAHLEGATAAKLVFTYNSSYTDEDGVLHGGITNDGREFVVDTRNRDPQLVEDGDTSESFRAPRGNVQITESQDDFYGTVEVNDGMTLTLGMTGNSELDSSFTNASGITLVKDAVLAVNSYQILPSFTGGSSSQLIMNSSANGYDSVAVFTGKVNFSGHITGAGSIIKAGTENLKIDSSSHTLATVTMSGTTTLGGDGAVGASSGVALLNASVIRSDESQAFKALVGGESSRIEINDARELTVGMTAYDLATLRTALATYYDRAQEKADQQGRTLADFRILYDAYYFATADKTAYVESPDGLQLEGISDFTYSKAATVIAGLGEGRPTHVDEFGSRREFSVADTIAYLKDPARFADTFAHIYATIDAETFDAMKTSSAWQGSRVIVADSLKGTFDNLLALDEIRAFVDSSPAGWTARELEDLLAFAESYSASRDGTVLFVRDAETQKLTLTRAGYRQLLDANVVKYMNLADGVPETFYDFISLFTDDYKFRFTTENLGYLTNIYGLDVSAINGKDTFEEKYEAFETLIGLSYEEGELPGFAGTLKGAVSLKKIGIETLRLTGVNEYTGSTSVEAGELRVDWDAIQKTSGVKVGENGLFTIVSEAGAENVFRIGGGVIYGSGVILKDGEGTLVIDAALGKKSANDFTGEIVVGKGELVVNVSDRETFSENVKVLLNAGTTFALNVADKNHTLDFKGEIVSGKQDAAGNRSYFVKDGAGTLVVSNGDAFGRVGNEFDVKVSAGTLQLNFKENEEFRDEAEGFTAALGKDAKLVFDVADGKVYSFAGLVVNETTTVETESGREIVPVTGTIFEKTGLGTLILDRQESAGTGAWTVNELKVTAGNLVLNLNSKYEFNKIVTAEGTNFVVNGTLVLDIASGESSEEKNVFGGTLSGDGNIEKTGEGELTLTASSFEGTLTLKKGSLVIDVEDGVERLLEFDLDVDAEDAAPTIKKTGAGSAEFTGSADLGGVKILVDAGTLKFNGGELVEDGVTSAVRTPSQIGIAEKATLEIAPATGMDLSAVALSGKGTFALGAATADVTVNVNNATLAADEAAGKEAFTGTFRLGEYVTLELAGDVTSIGGIEGSGTADFQTGANELWINPNRDVVFTGEIKSGNANADTTLNVGGTGLFDISNATLTNIDAIAVGSGANVGVDLGNTCDVKLADGATLSLVGDVDDDVEYLGPVTISGENSTIGISFSGELTYSGGTGTAFSALEELVQNVDYEDGATPENVTLIISNRIGEDLTLKLANSDPVSTVSIMAEEPVLGPVDFTRDNVELVTNAGGTLTLDTSAVAERGAIYRKTISGTGNFEKAGAGMLTLSAAAQTYTGETIVSEGTLAFNAGTTLATSRIRVADGATLQGGVTLTEPSASVNFADGSTYRLNISAGEALRYTGGLSLEGTLTLDIAQNQSSRGMPLSIFEYVGSGEGTPLAHTFSLGEANDTLYIDDKALLRGNLTVYVAQKNFRDVPADYHDGLDELLDVLSVWARPEGGYLTVAEGSAEYAIADALNKTSLGSLGDEITKLSPLGFAAMVTMPHAGFSADARSLSGRLEQRLYDASSAIWVYAQDVEFFAQAQGSTVDNGSDSDAATFDYDTYGALVGADVKFSKYVTAGVALAYDRGKAKLHDGGGKIDSDDVRATAFAGFLLNDYLALNVGAQVGYAKFDTKRNTLVGSSKGDTDAWHGGVFADFVGAYALATWGETSRLDLLPHAGLAFSYYRTDKFNEKGSAASLATDSFDAFSLEASVGAKLNYVFDIDGHGTRIGLDFSLIHEFLDDEVEIDSRLAGSKFSTDARALSETTFSFAPGVSFDVTDKASVFLNYELRLGTESEVAHRANLGFRYRF
ncbi:MAG: autotransporter domain-containing protein [Candidatus Spyradosoma sp.]